MSVERAWASMETVDLSATDETGPEQAEPKATMNNSVDSEHDSATPAETPPLDNQSLSDEQGSISMETVDLGTADTVVDGREDVPTDQPPALSSSTWSTNLTQPVAIRPRPPMTVNTSTSLPPTRRVNLTSPLPKLVDSFRVSAISAVKRTRQSISEKLGHGSKTVDAELEARIDALRDAQRRYVTILQTVRSFIAHFSALVNSQQALGAEFADQAQKMPELHDEFAYNATTQRALHKNGETLLCALNFFASSVNTLCYKTIDDTMATVRQYEDARVEYDAYRSDVESHQVAPDVQQRFEQIKSRFEQLRQALDVKLKFLDENKVKVMHQQLILFHNAIAAYFSGNQAALEDTLHQFSIKVKSPNSVAPSWLESQQQ